jgi:hypothetical protein
MDEQCDCGEMDSRFRGNDGLKFANRGTPS